MNGLDFESLGYGVVTLFVLSWMVSMAYYKYKGYDKLAYAATKRSR